jgi:hypothetical protein
VSPRKSILAGNARRVGNREGTEVWSDKRPLSREKDGRETWGI